MYLELHRFVAFVTLIFLLLSDDSGRYGGCLVVQFINPVGVGVGVGVARVERCRGVGSLSGLANFRHASWFGYDGVVVRNPSVF